MKNKIVNKFNLILKSQTKSCKYLVVILGFFLIVVSYMSCIANQTLAQTINIDDPNIKLDLDEGIETPILTDQNLAINLQFTKPTIGDQFLLGDDISISLTGDYNQSIIEPFKVEFSVCFIDPGTCLNEKIIEDIIYIPVTDELDNASFSIHIKWLNAGYLLDGTQIIQSMINNNIYINANVFNESDSSQIYANNISSGTFSINDKTVTVINNIVRPDANYPTWVIGDTELIEWVIIVSGKGGNPGISQYSIYYAVDKTNNWVPIEENIALVGTSPKPYNWLVPEINNKLLGSDFRIKISTMGADESLIAEGISEIFIIESSPARLGTYISKEITIIDDVQNEQLKSLDKFKVVVDETVDGINSKLEFYARFIKSDGSYLGNNLDGFIVADYKTNSLELGSLDLSLVEKVQFKIYMETTNVFLYNPWVESLCLEYSINSSNYIFNIVVPLEGGVSDDFSQPKFVLRLCPTVATDNSLYAIEERDLFATSYDGDNEVATLDINITSDKLIDGETYIAYLRTNRHLWAKATMPINGEVVIYSSSDIYNLVFPNLIAGDIAGGSDINHDNIINSLDVDRGLKDFGKLVTGLISDFNNDGVVNSIDLGLLFSNLFKTGELPT